MPWKVRVLTLVRCALHRTIWRFESWLRVIDAANLQAAGYDDDLELPF